MKTTKLKGFIAALLSVAVMASAGCGNNNTAPAESSTTTTTSAAAETTAAAETASTTETTTAASSETTAVTSAEETAQTDENAQADTGIIDVASLIPADLEIKPALWKATDPASGNSIYLMGTFHAVPEGTYPLPDYIEDVYANSDGIAVEYDTDKLTDSEQLDMAAVQEYNAALVYADGTLLADHISDETYNALKSFADSTLGGWNEMYDYYNIGFWISTISSYQVMEISGFDFNQGVDRYFTAKAKADSKSVTDIEDLSVQLGAINAYTDALGDYVIKDTIDNLGDNGEFAQTLADLYIAWVTGNVDEAEALNEESMADEEMPEELVSDIERYFDITYYSRNKGMADKAAEFIKNGDNVFFMVGFAHFAGENGIPALLTDMGYTVEKLY